MRDFLSVKAIIIRQTLLLIFIPFAITSAQPTPSDNLQFDHLAKRWDEAMPLGNGMLGVLIWGKHNRLRLSLDRADIWDERKAVDLSTFDFKWVKQQVLKNDYEPVHQKGDAPYDNIAYPTKLPAAATTTIPAVTARSTAWHNGSSR